MKISEISIHVATDKDLPKIISFLSRPEIDKGFCKPLSDRNITIPQRVYLKFDQGVWGIAEIKSEIVSCIAILPKEDGVLFSTFACINSIKCKYVGGCLWKESLRLSQDIFDASHIEIDSWVGNEFINTFLTKRGFKKIKTYFDPDKRPPSVQSVLYRMQLKKD